MLWYVDAISYKTSGFAMTGLVYRHNDLGALPIGHYSLMNLKNLNVHEEESFNCDSMFRVLPTKGMDYTVLSAEDKQVLDTVIKKFKNYSAKEIVTYMHQERAYRETKSGEIIPFSLAKDIKNF